ncbi:MAG: hypothetical protein AAGB30_00065 [Pedobacter sp.]
MIKRFNHLLLFVLLLVLSSCSIFRPSCHCPKMPRAYKTMEHR